MEEVVHTKGTPEGRKQLEEFPREFLDKRRCIPGEPKKSFEATQLWDNYQEIARRIVLGQKNVEIANDLGVTSVMVSYVRNSPIVQEQIGKLHEMANVETANISARIKSIAPKALDLLESIIKDGKVGHETVPVNIRARHAENMLDRAGYAPPKEIRSLNLSGHFTSEDIENLKKRAVNGAQAQATLIVNDEDAME